MKIASDTPLEVSLRWDTDDIQPVGRLGYQNRTVAFEFNEAFLSSGLELSPLRHRARGGLHLPYRAEVFEGLHGIFNDSLPDAWGRFLVDRRARLLGINPATLTPLDRLACVGSCGMGALCYAPAIEPWETGNDGINLDGLATDARRVLRGEVTEMLSALGKAGSSPGGARPKVLVALNDRQEAVHGTEDAPQGYIPYLVKFPGPSDPEDIAHIEMAYSMMAREAGVGMSETRLLAGAKGQFYFAARRFDRDGTRRMHVHTASGLLYSDIRVPALDYRDLIMLTRAVTRDQRECQAMFTLAVFNVLSHNRDDHARQFSYVMERDGAWSLGPAYDLTFAEGPGGEHATSVLGHGKDITKDNLLALGGQADIREQDARRIIERVEDAVANWESFAAACDVGNSSKKEIAVALRR